MKFKKILSAISAVIMLLSAVSCSVMPTADTETEKGPESTSESRTTEQVPVTEDDHAGVTLSVSVTPAPVKAVISDKGADAAECETLALENGEYADIFAKFGFRCAADTSKTRVSVVTDPSLEEEEYKLSVKKNEITVTASGREGVFLAVSTLAQLRQDDLLAAAEIEDKPAVPYRGVIEGFYGVAWTHSYRLDLFEFMGKYKLNTYIYAPKDDPKHRAEWRSMYTGVELNKMKELVGSAASNNVRFVYALSPGLDIKLGDGYEKDLEQLFKKCGSMYELGVRDFAILLDDIPTLNAEGHAKLVNDFQNKFVKTHDGCRDLIMITPEFCTATMTGYSNKIAPLIDPDIMIMWTGYGVIPPSISAAEMANVNSKFGRKMYIWWNYPVNDYAANELFMGPCENLDKKLDTEITGLVSNPMNQGYASFVPLVTVAEYLWSPSSYDPEKSLETAVGLVCPECPDGLYSLIDLTRNTAINGNKSTFSLRNEIEAFNKNEEGAAEKLREKLTKIKNDLAAFSEKGDKKLLKETEKWVKKAVLLVDSALHYVDYRLGGDKLPALEFVNGYLQSEKNAAAVSADVLVPFLSAARADINAAFGQSASDGKKASSTLNTYENYLPDNAVDGDTSTFYWSAGAPVGGSTFTVDLGTLTDMTGVRLLMGVDSHPDDYIRNGVIEYSADGKKYEKLCDTTGRETKKDANFRARYVRVRCLKEQVYWLIVSEFEIKTKFELPEGVTFDGGADLLPLFDHSIFTAFSPSVSAVKGKTLKIDAKYNVTLYLLDTKGVRVQTENKDGSVTDTELPDTDGCAVVDLSGIDRDKAAYILVTFGSTKASIAEITLE